MATPPEDAHLLAQFREPETRDRAFNQLVRTYQQPLYRIIRRILIDHDETDDVLQDVLVKVYRNLANFREDAKLSTWLYRVATNEALSALRKKKRRYLLPIHDVERELAAKIDSTPEVSGDEIARRLHKAMLRLPERQRMVFQLKYFEEMKYEDMAQVLGVTEGALKASYHHAVKKIEKFLAEG